MTHKAETLIQAVEAAVTGLPTTGASVTRTRGYAVAATPAIDVRLASIDFLNELSPAFIDDYVYIDLVYSVSGSGLDAQILQIDAEVFAAIMADRTLAGSALDADPQSLTPDQAPAETEEPTAEAIRRFRFQIRHATTSAEV